MKRIYLDHAGTTPMRAEVIDVMIPFFKQKFGNASGICYFSREAKDSLESARGQISKVIGAQSEEIYFTSGGTESDNWAIRGVLGADKGGGNHVITTSIEHHAILHTCEEMEKCGYKVTYLSVDNEGIVDVKDVISAITDETKLVSIMHANNEVGTIEPISEIGKAIKSINPKIIFHTDAVQTFGKIPVNVEDLKVDLLSVSSHKIYGPKGVGALYIRKGTRIKPIITGGAQERQRRSGTENIPGIVGFGKAAELAGLELEAEQTRLELLRDKFIEEIMNSIPYVHLNGHPLSRLPNNVNISFEFIEGESLLLNLDMKGVCASSGSACTSGSLDPSHVLLSMGIPSEIAHGSLRLTLGRDTNEEDMNYVVEILPDIVDKLRELSPLFAKKEVGIKNV